MYDFQLFDGIAFSWLENDPATSRIGRMIHFDLLPPCACGTPSADALLRFIFALIDGGFAGVRELNGKEQGTSTSLVLTNSDLASDKPFWLSIDLDSIEGMAVMSLLLEIKSSKPRTEYDLVSHALHFISEAYSNAGRGKEFHAAVQRILARQRQEGAMQ